MMMMIMMMMMMMMMIIIIIIIIIVIIITEPLSLGFVRLILKFLWISKLIPKNLPKDAKILSQMCIHQSNQSKA